MKVYKSYYFARKENRFSVIAKCEGGYIAFDSMADYKIWRGQK